MVLAAPTLGGAALRTGTRVPIKECWVVVSAIGDLLDNPKTRAILDKYLPGFSSADQIDAARNMTLRAVQPYAADTVTDEALERPAERGRVGYSQSGRARLALVGAPSVTTWFGRCLARIDPLVESCQDAASATRPGSAVTAMEVRGQGRLGSWPVPLNRRR